MKRVLFLSLGILLTAGMAFGQAGYIGLFSDVGYTNCTMYDAPGLETIYAVHKASTGSTACQFKIAVDPGMTCTGVGVINAFPTTIGTPGTGISVAYGACYPSDILLLTWNFFCSGTSTPCSMLQVVPDPSALSGTIEVVDCDLFKLVGGGSIMFVNPDGNCDCGEIVPVRESSWGAIKALYE